MMRNGGISARNPQGHFLFQNSKSKKYLYVKIIFFYIFFYNQSENMSSIGSWPEQTEFHNPTIGSSGK